MEIFNFIKDTIKNNLPTNKDVTKGLLIGCVGGIGAVCLNKAFQKKVESSSQIRIENDPILNNCYYITLKPDLFENIKYLYYYIYNFLAGDYASLVSLIEQFLTFTSQIKTYSISYKEIPRILAINEKYEEKIVNLLIDMSNKINSIIEKYELCMDIANKSDNISKSDVDYITTCFKCGINNISKTHLNNILNELKDYIESISVSNSKYIKLM